MKRKRGSLIIEDHHILPRSRGGDYSKHNIKKLEQSYHRAYHKLFENLTPDEIHQYLNEVYFNAYVFVSPAQWLVLKKHHS